MADALDDRAGELAVIADTETALGGERLTGEVRRATGQLRLFAAVLRDGGGAWGGRPPGAAPLRQRGRHPGRRRSARPAPDQPAGRSGGRVRGVELPVRVLRGRRRHGVRAGGRLSRGGQGARGASGYLAGVRRDRDRGAGFRRGARGSVRAGRGAGSLRLLRHPAIAAAGFTGSTAGGLALARIAAQRPVPIPFYGELGSVNPSWCCPARHSAAGRDRRRVHRLADARHRPVLHQPRPAVRPGGRRPAHRDRRGGRRFGRRGLLSGRIFANYAKRWKRPRRTPASPNWPRVSRVPVPGGRRRGCSRPR